MKEQAMVNSVDADCDIMYRLNSMLCDITFKHEREQIAAVFLWGNIAYAASGNLVQVVTIKKQDGILVLDE